MHLHKQDMNGSVENRNSMKVPVSYIKKQGIDSSSMVGELKTVDQGETQLEKKRKTMGCKVKLEQTLVRFSFISASSVISYSVSSHHDG